MIKKIKRKYQKSNKKRVKLFSFLFALFLSLVSGVAYATVVNGPGAIPNGINSYNGFVEDSTRYTSYAWFPKDGFMGLGNVMSGVFNSFVQAIFWVAKRIFEVCALIYDKLTDTSAIDGLAKSVINTSGSIFEALRSGDNAVVSLLLILMVVYLLWNYFVNNANFFKGLFRYLMVVGVAFMLFTKNGSGEYKLWYLYNKTSTAIDQVVSSLETTFNNSVSKDNPNGLLSSNGTSKDMVLNAYFSMAIWDNYRGMNSVVTSNDGKVNYSVPDDVLKQFPGYDWSTKGGAKNKLLLNGKGYTIKQLIEDDVAGYNKKDFKLLGGGSFKAWGQKFTYAVSGIIDASSLGVLLAGLGIARFVASITVLIIFIVLPICLMMALVPTMENVLFNIFKKLLFTTFFSSGINLIVLVTLWVYDVIDAVLVGLFVANGFVLAFAKLITLWTLYKKRDSLLSLVTANRTKGLSNGFTQFIDRKADRLKQSGVRAKDKVKSVAASGVGSAVDLGQKAYGATTWSERADARKQVRADKERRKDLARQNRVDAYANYRENEKDLKADYKSGALSKEAYALGGEYSKMARDKELATADSRAARQVAEEKLGKQKWENQRNYEENNSTPKIGPVATTVKAEEKLTQEKEKKQENQKTTNSTAAKPRRVAATQMRKEQKRAVDGTLKVTPSFKQIERMRNPYE